MAAVSNGVKASLELSHVSLISLGVPQSLDSMSPCSDGTWGSPDRSRAFLIRPQVSSAGFFCNRLETFRTVAVAFAPGSALGSVQGPLSLVISKHFSSHSNPRLMQPWASSHPHLGHPPTPPHRSVKEPARTRGSSGTFPRERPSLGCPTQRGLWKVWGALSSTLGWPISTHLPSAQGLPSSPLDAPADLCS